MGQPANRSLIMPDASDNDDGGGVNDDDDDDDDADTTDVIHRTWLATLA